MKVKKELRGALALVLAVMLVMLAGCGGSTTNESSGTPSTSTSPSSTEVAKTTDPSEKVTLKIAVWDAGSGRAAQDYAMKTFTEKFPNVTFDPVYSPDIATLIKTKIAAGDDKDMFDLMDSSTVDSEPLIREKKLESQEDLWDREVYDTPGLLLKDALLKGMYENKIPGKPSVSIPTQAWTGGLYFDKAFFEKNGWNQHPKTWDEFTTLLEQIKAAGIIPITYPGVYAGYLGSSFGYKDFELANINGKLDQYTSDYRAYNLPSFTTPENVEKWKRIFELGRKGYFPKGVAALNHTQSQMQVMQHKAAMVSTGSWVQNEMKTATPDGFKWGFMGVPFSTQADDTVWLTFGIKGGNVIWAAKPDLNKKWAKAFDLWLFNLDCQKVSAENGELPVRRDFSDDPSRAASLQDAPKSILEYLKTTNVSFEGGDRNVTFSDPAFAQANKTLDDAIPGITLGKEDPGPILEKAEGLLKKAIGNEKKK